MQSATRHVITAFLAVCTQTLGAQTTSVAAPTVAIRALPAPTSTSAEAFGALASVRHLPNGTVLVNDQARRRVLLLDSALKTIGIVLDSVSGARAYGVAPGGLIPYRGDSTLFVDPAGLSMIVIGPAGSVVRVMAAPRDVTFLADPTFGAPGFDARGRLVYRAGMASSFTPRPGQPPMLPAPPDTVALVAVDLANRKVDTLTFYHIPARKLQRSQAADGSMHTAIETNPLSVVDGWAVMNDGTVAVVRGREYRAEFIDPDGKRTMGARIPHDWQHLSDQDKVVILDSARVALERQRAQLAPPSSGGFVSAGAAPPAGSAGSMGAPPSPPSVVFVPASELPDYKPVFGSGAVNADAEGHVWVRTIPTKLLPGGAVYDVIDRGGKLVDRVQVPTSTTVAGFGAGGVVYLGVRDATGTHLQRARMR